MVQEALSIPSYASIPSATSMPLTSHPRFVIAISLLLQAVELVKSNSDYDEEKCKAFVFDLTQE